MNNELLTSYNKISSISKRYGHTTVIPFIISAVENYICVVVSMIVSDHSPTANAKVMSTWSYTTTSQYIYMAWCLINWIHLHDVVLKHRDNFTFT
jgi:hypothetical protein